MEEKNVKQFLYEYVNHAIGCGIYATPVDFF